MEPGFFARGGDMSDQLVLHRFLGSADLPMWCPNEPADRLI
jgi:hypothetical protein